MQGRIAVVDAENRFLRWEDRRAVHAQRLPHRSVHVLLFDTQGRLVIQRRHRNKLTYASYWDCSASGHVEEEDYPAGPDAQLDHVYETTAQRELQEELGVSAPLRPLGHTSPAEGHYEEARLFWAVADGPYTIQEAEVEEVRAVTRAEFETLLGSGDLVTPMLQLVLARRGAW